MLIGGMPLIWHEICPVIRQRHYMHERSRERMQFRQGRGRVEHTLSICENRHLHRNKGQNHHNPPNEREQRSPNVTASVSVLANKQRRRC
jgi:hypothetical protein